MEAPIIDIRRSTISEASPSRRHSFTPTTMKRVDDRRRFSQVRPSGHSDSSLPFRERSASSRSGSSRGRHEDDISAPFGREIAVPTRQAFTTGRGGVGNRSLSVESGRQREESQALSSQEQKVISQYKAKNAPTYATGRGGAGAKGHVKVRGLVPNTEMALAKERNVQYRWNLEKNMKGDAKIGRGGSGNIFKGRSSYEGRSNSNSFDNSEIRASSSRADSRREHVPAIRESKFNYGFGYAPTIKSRSNSMFEQPLDGDENDIPSTVDLEVDAASRIASPTSRPLPPRSSTPSNRTVATAAMPTSLNLEKGKNRVPNEVAPFEEPRSMSSSKSSSHQPMALIDKDMKKSDSKSLFKSFKRLRVGKTKESKRTTRSGGVADRPTLDIIRSQKDSAIEVHASTVHSHHIMDIMETPSASASAPTTTQTISSTYPYPYLDQLLGHTPSDGTSSHHFTLEGQVTRSNTAAESGSESSRRNSTSTSTSAANSVHSNPNSVINSVTLELTSQASREWFPQRRRNSFWRSRPLPIPPDMRIPVHIKESNNSSTPL